MLDTGGGAYEELTEFIAHEEQADAVLLVVANGLKGRGRMLQEVCVSVDRGHHAEALRLLAVRLREVADDLEGQAAAMGS